MADASRIKPPVKSAVVGRRTSVVGSGLTLLTLAIVVGADDPPVADRGGADRDLVVVEDVFFQHRGDRLAGSLYRPHGPGPFPAVVMVLGSGPADRDYGGIGPALGKHFARSGFASLIWDKPGVGRSTGDYNAQTFRDRAEEVLTAVRFLRGRIDISRERIGLWGHSQGGMVAPLAASLSGEVAFLIEVAGWQGPAWQQDAVRVEAELREAGFPAADVDRAVSFARKRMDLIRGSGPFEELEKAQDAVKSRPWFRSVHACDRPLFDSARRMVEYDTTPSWSRVRCPVLVLYGGRDTSSGPPERLVSLIRGGLELAGNRDVTVRIFPDADHSLRRAGSADRRSTDIRARPTGKLTDRDFVFGYLETMSDWLGRKFGKSTGPP